MLLMTEVLVSFAGIFCICDFGERISDAFEDINILIEELKWYLLPSETQLWLATILTVAQRPVNLEIFGTMSCNRRTFKEVRRFHLPNKFYTNNFSLTQNNYTFGVVRCAIQHIPCLWYFNDSKIELKCHRCCLNKVKLSDLF